MFTTFADALWEILIEIPSDWIAHRADDQRAAAGDGLKLQLLQRAKPFNGHLDERVVQPLCRGLFEPFLEVLGERLSHFVKVKGSGMTLEESGMTFGILF